MKTCLLDIGLCRRHPGLGLLDRRLLLLDLTRGTHGIGLGHGQ